MWENSTASSSYGRKYLFNEKRLHGYAFSRFKMVFRSIEKNCDQTDGNDDDYINEYTDNDNNIGQKK